MLVNDESEYRFSLEFPVLKFYDVDRVFDFIALVVYENNRPPVVERTPIRPGFVIESAKSWARRVSEKNVEVSAAPPAKTLDVKNSDEDAKIQREWESKIAELRKYKKYLLDRLLRAVHEGRFEVWDAGRGKVAAPPPLDKCAIGEIRNLSIEAILPVPGLVASNSPPSHHQSNFQNVIFWMKFASLLKPGLIEFCRAEGIRVTFEGKQATSGEEGLVCLGEKILVTFEGEKILGQVSNPISKNCLDEDKDRVQAISNQSAGVSSLVTDDAEQCSRAENTISDKRQSSDNGEPPAILPDSIEITKLAIKIAWEIEYRNGGKRASARETIKKLQDFVGNADYPELTEKTLHGIKWTTISGVVKPYDVDTCRATLKRWNKRRALILTGAVD